MNQFDKLLSEVMVGKSYEKVIILMDGNEILGVYKDKDKLMEDWKSLTTDVQKRVKQKTFSVDILAKA